MLLAEALDSGASVESVYATADQLGADAVRAAADAGVPVKETAPDALAKVLDLKAPRGVVAVVRRRVVALAEVLSVVRVEQRPVLVAVALQDPGNVGTLIRAAEAFECAGVVLTDGSVDLYNPKTVRSTAGALFRIPVVESVELDEVLDACEPDVTPYATVGRAGSPIDEVRLTGAVAVLVGAEAHGLDPSVQRRCAGALTVPMAGAAESLNAAVAGSIVLYEAARQRRGREAATEVQIRSGGAEAGMGHNVDSGTNGDPGDPGAEERTDR